MTTRPEYENLMDKSDNFIHSIFEGKDWKEKRDMKDQQINEYIVKRHDELPANRWCKAIAEELEKMGAVGKFGEPITRNGVRCRYDRWREANEPEREEAQMPLEDQIEEDRAKFIRKDDERVVTKKYRKTIEENERLRLELEAQEFLRNNTGSHVIKPREDRSSSESTVISVWSDWHVEERVNPETVNGLNEFNLDIAKKRIEKLVRKNVDFIKMFQQDTTITEMVLALLGDFISNDIHDEFAETGEVRPMEAMVWVQDMLISSIQYILDHTEVNLTIPCHSGNHARTTEKTHVSTEFGHSLEWFMYQNMARYFRNEPRITFLIPKSYFSYVEVYGQVIRFHHGHQITYGGGVGRLFVPAFRTIDKFNESRRADLDVFGHFHVTYDGNRFVCNGSLIGYNPYAVKFGYEVPKQLFFLMHRELGRSIMAPIYL